MLIAFMGFVPTDAEEDHADVKMARHYHMKVRRENGGGERLASPGGLGHPFSLPLRPLTLGSGPPGLAASAGKSRSYRRRLQGAC